MRSSQNKPWLYALAAFLLCATIAATIIVKMNNTAKAELAAAREASYSEGYDAGREDGELAGYDDGYDDGKQGNLSPADKRTVYVTPSGRKYHRKSCSSIKGHDTEKLQTWEAKERGYTACARCNP